MLEAEVARAQSIVDYYANLLKMGLEGLDSFVCFFEVVVSGPQTVIVLCAEFDEDKIDRATAQLEKCEPTLRDAVHRLAEYRRGRRRSTDSHSAGQHNCS